MAQDAAMSVEQTKSVTTTQNTLYESFTYEAIEEARDARWNACRICGFRYFDGKEYVSQAARATMASRTIFGLFRVIESSHLQPLLSDFRLAAYWRKSFSKS